MAKKWNFNLQNLRSLGVSCKFKTYWYKKAIQKHITIEKTSKDALNNVKTELQNCDVLKNINRNINLDVNSNYRLFEESIISAKTKHMHTKIVRFNKTIHKQNSWMTDDLLKQTNFKNKLYKQFKQTPPNNPEYERRKINLETCKRIYRRDIESAKKHIILSCLTSIKQI